jgi:hypothetical protein
LYLHTYIYLTIGDEIQVEIDRHHGRTFVSYELFKQNGKAVFESPAKGELKLYESDRQWGVLYFTCSLYLSQVTLIPSTPQRYYGNISNE